MVALVLVGCCVACKCTITYFKPEYNPLPIGQSAPNPSGTPGLGRRRKMVNPAAGPVGDHSSRTHGPQTLTTIDDCPVLLPQTPSSPSFPQLAFFTSRVLYFSRSQFLAFFIPHPPPQHRHSLRPHCHIGKHRW